MTTTKQNVTYVATPLHVNKGTENKTTVTQSHYHENHMSNYRVSTPADDQRQVHKTCGMHCQRLQPTDRGIATFVIVNVFPNGASETYWRKSSKKLHYTFCRTVNGSSRSEFTWTLKLLNLYTTATICHHYFGHKGCAAIKFTFAFTFPVWIALHYRLVHAHCCFRNGRVNQCSQRDIHAMCIYYAMK